MNSKYIITPEDRKEATQMIKTIKKAKQREGGDWRE